MVTVITTETGTPFNSVGVLFHLPAPRRARRREHRDANEEFGRPAPCLTGRSPPPMITTPCTRAVCAINGCTGETSRVFCGGLTSPPTRIGARGATGGGGGGGGAGTVCSPTPLGISATSVPSIPSSDDPRDWLGVAAVISCRASDGAASAFASRLRLFRRRSRRCRRRRRCADKCHQRWRHPQPIAVGDYEREDDRRGDGECVNDDRAGNGVAAPPAHRDRRIDDITRNMLSGTAVLLRHGALHDRTVCLRARADDMYGRLDTTDRGSSRRPECGLVVSNRG